VAKLARIRLDRQPAQPRIRIGRCRCGCLRQMGETKGKPKFEKAVASSPIVGTWVLVLKRGRVA